MIIIRQKEFSKRSKAIYSVLEAKNKVLPAAQKKSAWELKREAAGLNSKISKGQKYLKENSVGTILKDAGGKVVENPIAVTAGAAGFAIPFPGMSAVAAGAGKKAEDYLKKNTPYGKLNKKAVNFYNRKVR